MNIPSTFQIHTRIGGTKCSYSALLLFYSVHILHYCRCCGTVIIDVRESRKVSSNTVRPLVPILIRLLGEHYYGEKTDTQLLLPSGSFESVYICRQPCLYALQRFQKLET